MSSNTEPIENFSLMCQPQPGSISRYPVDVVLDNNIFSNILRKYPTKSYKFLCRIFQLSCLHKSINLKIIKIPILI